MPMNRKNLSSKTQPITPQPMPKYHCHARQFGLNGSEGRKLRNAVSCLIYLGIAAALTTLPANNSLAQESPIESEQNPSIDGIVLDDLQENQPPELFEKLFGNSLSSRPVPKSGPTVIFYGVEIEDIRAIEASARRYYVRGYLWTYWRDARAKLTEDLLGKFKDSHRAARSIKWNAKPLRERKLVWDPELELVNADSDLELTTETIEVFPPKPGGNEEPEVEYWCRFSGWFSDQADLLDFHSFPFDRQRLVVDIVSSYNADQVEFRRCWELTEEDTQLLSSRLKHPEWFFKSVEIVGTNWSYVSENSGKFSLGRTMVTAQRKPHFYATNLGVPIGIILLLFNCLIWIKRTEFEAKLGGIITCLLSLVAFSLVVNSEVPKIPYMTVFGKAVLASFVIITTGAILTVLDHLWNGKAPASSGSPEVRNTRFLRYGAMTLNLGSAAVVLYFLGCWLWFG
jgi:hypothetical protein